MITTAELRNWLAALTQGLPIQITEEASAEVLRVYELGVWAEKSAISTLRLIEENPGWSKAYSYARDAIEFLPKYPQRDSDV